MNELLESQRRLTINLVLVSAQTWKKRLSKTAKATRYYLYFANGIHTKTVVHVMKTHPGKNPAYAPGPTHNTTNDK